MKFPSEVKLQGVINYIYKRTPIYVVPLIISGFVLVKMLKAKFIKICTYAIVLEYENPNSTTFCLFFISCNLYQEEDVHYFKFKIAWNVKKEPKKKAISSSINILFLKSALHTQATLRTNRAKENMKRKKLSAKSYLQTIYCTKLIVQLSIHQRNSYHAYLKLWH